MTDDAATFEPVNAREDLDVSTETTMKPPKGGWPTSLETTWGAASLWFILGLLIVGAVYGLTLGLGIHGQSYESPNEWGEIAWSPWGTLVGGGAAVLAGFGIARGQRTFGGRQLARYGLLVLGLLPGVAASMFITIILAFLLHPVLQLPTQLAIPTSFITGFFLLMGSVKILSPKPLWPILVVSSVGLLGAALATSPFARPDENLFLDVAFWSAIVPILFGFAALRPLYARRPQEGIWSRHILVRFYGGALLFALGSVLMFVGEWLVLSGSAVATA